MKKTKESKVIKILNKKKIKIRNISVQHEEQTACCIYLKKYEKMTDLFNVKPNNFVANIEETLRIKCCCKC